MPRIPSEELERIKRDIRVEDLIRAAGVELEAHGSNLIGLCPLHEDHEPSLVVTPAKNLWHCLGACQAGGTTIDWVMRSQGVSFRHAVEILRHPEPAAINGRIVKRNTVPKLPLPVDADGDEQMLRNQVVAFYHETFKREPGGAAYLESRGLRSAELVERFRLGLANRTLGLRVPNKKRNAGADLRARLEDIGILRKTGHEHFNGCIVIPIFDEHGNVVEIYGRKITPRLRAGTALHLYLPGPHRGVWNIAALEASREIILTESLIDALTFWSAGFRNVTASYGVEGFTNDHLAAFRQYGTERVLIAYDRDAAGERAAEKLAAKLCAHGIAPFRIEFPHGMDANEYALRVTPAPKSLAVLIQDARFLGHGARPEITTVPHEPAVHLVAENDDEPLPQAAGDQPQATSTETPESAFRLAAAAVDSPAVSNGSQPPAPPPARPPTPRPDSRTPQTEVREHEVLIIIGDRHYRIRGLRNNTSCERLSVNLRATRHEIDHSDTLDLCHARHRDAFIKRTAQELGVEAEVIKRDLGKVHRKLEELQDALIDGILAPREKTVELDADAEREALELLRDSNLLERILTDFERCGVVGERTNKLVGYLAAVSRLLPAPLGIMIQSTSAAGKSALMDAVLAFLPDEAKVKYSAMTGQSLFYMGDTNLRHKVLAIAEEEGASRATYALKLLQSEGELSIASAGKDPQSGKHVTHEYHVDGPVMVFFTTTAVDLDEELENRCMVLAVDESREQTRAIHERQRFEQTARGMWERRQRPRIRKLHQNAQRLLRPLDVDNPFVDRLRFPDTSTRTRRDHMKYLTLIQAIALLYQHQRPVRTVSEAGGEQRELIEVTREDVVLANEIASEVLGRSLDELAPQTRHLLLLIHDMVEEGSRKQGIERTEYRFTRRQVREHTSCGHSQLALHMKRLEELEYVLVHRGKNGQGFVYELLYNGEGQQNERFLMGLIDPDRLDKRQYDDPMDTNLPGSRTNLPASAPNRPGPIRPASGPLPGTFRTGRNGSEVFSDSAQSDSAAQNGRKTHMGAKDGAASYARVRRSGSASRFPVASSQFPDPIASRFPVAGSRFSDPAAANGFPLAAAASAQLVTLHPDGTMIPTENREPATTRSEAECE